jgi:acyl phosphate:glycerol-3-phosphate acyltransferase
VVACHALVRRGGLLSLEMTAAFILFGYLLGSIPFGLLLTWAAGLGDIRGIGSGNIGATNVLRTGRRDLAAATLLLDLGKGAAAVLLAGWLGGPQAALWAGAGAVIGHLAPVWLRFRGGKGVATALGVLLAAAWPVGLLACATWLATAGLVRISSLASLAAVGLAPFFAWALADSGTVKLSLVVAVLVYARHHANIRRLLAGTEPKIGR